MARQHCEQASRLRKGVTLLAGILVFTACAAAGDPPAAKTDRLGEPLPPGALARLGTLRWRHSEDVTFVALLPGDKTVLTGGLDNTFRLWERGTGKELHRITIPVQPVAQPGVRPVPIAISRNFAGRGPTVSLSKDGKTLAAVVAGNKIQLWDVATGKEAREIQGPQNVIAIQFAPDGKSLAVRAADYSIRLFETETSKEIRQIRPKLPENKGGPVRFVFNNGRGDAGLVFSPDGKLIAGAEATIDLNMIVVHLKVYSTEAGTEVRRFDLPQIGTSAFAFTPDSKLLAYGNATTIVMREPESGKEVRQFNAQVEPANLVFAPDGKSLAAKGRDSVVRVFETESGKELHKLGEPAAGPGINVAVFRNLAGGGHDLCYSADGKTIAAAAGHSIRLWDADSGKEQPLVEGHRGPVSSLGVSADGKVISRGADGFIRRWDAGSGEELGNFREPPGTLGIAFAPDGKTVALGANDGSIRICAADTGKELHRMKGHQGGTAMLAYAPNGKVLATRGVNDNVVKLFDAEKATELRHIELPGANPAMGAAVVIRSGFPSAAPTLAFSPDSRTLFAHAGPAPARSMVIGGKVQQVPGSPSAVRMWDVGTGKEIRQIATPNQNASASMALTPDGRVLAVENPNQTVSLLEIASGRERLLFGKGIPIPQPQLRSGFGGFVVGLPGIGNAIAATLAFSPDGKLLACREANNVVRIWDVDAAKEIGEFKGHAGPITAIAFSPDGKTLVSGSSDTTLLVWDVAGLKREPKAAPVELTAKSVEEQWNDLLSENTPRAFEGVLRLARASKQAAPFLANQLKAATPVDPKKLEKLIADLDSDDFEERTIAIQELEKLGDLAVPTLQKALVGQPTLETRRRVEPLLARLTGGTLTAEEIRVVRAIEVLERLGTPEAREIVERLAAGAPGALVTRQSQDVLGRMKR